MLGTCTVVDSTGATAPDSETAEAFAPKQAPIYMRIKYITTCKLKSQSATEHTQNYTHLS